MRYLSICVFCAICMFVVSSKGSNATQQNEVLMKNISDLHFKLFSSIQKKTKMIKTAAFETRCSVLGCTFNSCGLIGSDTLDGQMIQKLNKIQSSLDTVLKRKQPKAIDCKSGWKRYNGHCYYLYSTKLDWFEAQVFCRRQGAFLLQINDANENSWVFKTFTKVLYWIDYTDIGMTGAWVTLYTGKSDFANWNRGEPNNLGGNQHCACINHHPRGNWDDEQCTRKLQFVCEASGSGF